MKPNTIYEGEQKSMSQQAQTQIDPDKIYIPSEDVVARQIEDEFLLVPIASGIGDMEDSLYTLNESGKIIWEKMSREKTLNTLIDELAQEFDAPRDTIGSDVCGILTELIKLNMVACLD
jgi:hypothetical protein